MIFFYLITKIAKCFPMSVSYLPSHVNKWSFLSWPCVNTWDILLLFQETGQIRVGGVGLVSFPAASSSPMKGPLEVIPFIDARDNSSSKETTNEI